MNLIRRKQFLEAARFSHAFDLSVKFLPETILTSYLQNTMDDVGLSSTGNNSFEDQVYMHSFFLSHLQSIV